jgi:F0F1-type ATP synthase delta subunit
LEKKSKWRWGIHRWLVLLVIILGIIAAKFIPPVQPTISLASERDQEAQGLRGEVTSLALAAAGHLISQTLDAKQHKKIIDGFFTELQDEQKQMLKEIQLSGEKIDVTSALTLNKIEQNTIKNEINQFIKSKKEITFSVDPGILGGLRIRIGDQILDGSLSFRMQSLKKNLDS